METGIAMDMGTKKGDGDGNRDLDRDGEVK